MKIVIDIPNRLKEIADEYSKIDNKNLDELTYYRMNERLALFCISKGVPLPKGHGRLGDLDKLYTEMNNGIKAGMYEDGYENYGHINDMDDCLECVEYADTIIEADRGE